jgi:hypothetical protein
MKALLGITTLTTVLLLSPAYADHHMKDHMGDWDEQQMQMHNDEMEAHLEDMQALMDKLHATSDPAERRRLLEQHRKEMSELMKNMRGSREDMMMGMMGGGPRRGGPMPEGEKRRQYMIEKRLDMMDQAMEMMMQRDQMMMH